MQKIAYLCNNKTNNVFNTTNGDEVMRRGNSKGYSHGRKDGGRVLLSIIGLYIIFTYIVSNLY
jgi:hypothetical protein